MLINPNSHLFVYTITRDFGFAPNPFFGVCTLATCKPRIRKSSKVNDWVLGVGGKDLGNLDRKCIVLMKVTEKSTFQQYWDDSRFSIKKPLRNGSKVRMVGDNIYHKNVNDEWIQEDSHHSNPDGTAHDENLKRDTNHTDKIILSEQFIYFGQEAIDVDLNSIDYRRIRDYKKYSIDHNPASKQLIETIYNSNKEKINQVISDPYNFKEAHKRANQDNGKVY